MRHANAEFSVSFVAGGIVSVSLHHALLIYLWSNISQTTGHVWPFIFAFPVLASVGSGLLFTTHVNTHTSILIGYQILLGAGLGAAIQNAVSMNQA